ncbi:transcription termination factor NusA [Abiotrophia defectiva]|uniref:Transcription termination/antitermination protein NusA n=1 Tax=Abiotrophia defectiva ATCC 49176 TaxID=592010 RepID=W1Q5V0_ABIDE|nr:transcription termination factor NusA [Abiotrophia defectiva]ESK65269.1 transcription termination factor NusA [Abiotrophia defectiva ATCC 49176]QKH47662.1 transcription termination/antitermination protein NusA [Abiotrophia defectiva]
MSKELVKAMQVLEEEKGISRQVIKEALESALALAYKKNYDQAQNVEVQFDENKGTIKVYSVKEVVETNYDSTLEISLEEALKINRAYEIGDKIKFEVTPKDFGRIATQTAKHVIMQRIREAERENIFEEFSQYVDEIMTGTVERQDHRFIYVNIGRVEAIMPLGEQIPSEQFEPDQRIKVYVAKVDKTSKGPQIVVSRAHNDFLRRLFEQEVPEIYDGTVEVMAIAREAGDRAKVAVRSRDKNIDPVGTCVGPRGQRVQAIVNELNGENMDIIEWNEDPVVFIQNALSPAQVIKVDFNEEAHACIVVVPDNQLSLAIGKRGQNARLAARLTTYKIDIKSESSYADYLEEQAALALEAQAAAEAAQDQDSTDDSVVEARDQAVEAEEAVLEAEPASDQ